MLELARARHRGLRIAPWCADTKSIRPNDSDSMRGCAAIADTSRSAPWRLDQHVTGIARRRGRRADRVDARAARLDVGRLSHLRQHQVGEPRRRRADEDRRRRSTNDGWSTVVDARADAAEGIRAASRSARDQLGMLSFAADRRAVLASSVTSNTGPSSPAARGSCACAPRRRVVVAHRQRAAAGDSPASNRALPADAADAGGHRVERCSAARLTSRCVTPSCSSCSSFSVASIAPG